MKTTADTVAVNMVIVVVVLTGVSCSCVFIVANAIVYVPMKCLFSISAMIVIDITMAGGQNSCTVAINMIMITVLCLSCLLVLVTILLLLLLFWMLLFKL